MLLGGQEEVVVRKEVSTAAVPMARGAPGAEACRGSSRLLGARFLRSEQRTFEPSSAPPSLRLHTRQRLLQARTSRRIIIFRALAVGRLSLARLLAPAPPPASLQCSMSESIKRSASPQAGEGAAKRVRIEEPASEPAGAAAPKAEPASESAAPAAPKAEPATAESSAASETKPARDPRPNRNTGGNLDTARAGGTGRAETEDGETGARLPVSGVT